MKDYLALFNQHTGYQDFAQGSSFITPNVSYCIAEDEVHYNPYDRFNGHGYVDLGLPSGTLWATTNIGATTPEGYGNYYAWGETKPKADYSWSTYKFNPSGDGSTMTKYNETDGLTTLEAEDDVAHVLWGGEWHIPTQAQMQELIDNCTWTWDTVNEINGYTVSGNGNSIFFPCAGFYRATSPNYVGSRGTYWSSLLNNSKSYNANALYYFNSNNIHADSFSYRYNGNSVRPVIELPVGTPMGVQYTIASDSSNVRTATVGNREDNLRTLNVTMDSGSLYDVTFVFKGDIHTWEIVKTVGVYMSYSTGDIVEYEMAPNQTLSISYNSSQNISTIYFRSNDSGQQQSGLSLQYFECIVRSPQGKLYKIILNQEAAVA